MITIAKRFTFDAAHCLPMLPPEHKCHRMHGHTYGVEVQLRGEPDARGFIVDYEEIADAWAPLATLLDHHVLNEIDGLDRPSTEVLVAWIFDRLIVDDVIGSYLHAVRVSESTTTWAELTIDDYRRSH